MRPGLTVTLQRTAPPHHDGLDVHVDHGRPGLRPGEGRAGHDVLHAAPDLVLGHHHHDQHGLRRHSSDHGPGQVGRLLLLHLRDSLHHSAHPDHCGQLQQVRQPGPHILIMLRFRGYQKSIIEMELEEQRRGQGMLWQQTKESILEARGCLSSSHSLTGKHRGEGGVG